MKYIIHFKLNQHSSNDFTIFTHLWYKTVKKKAILQKSTVMEILPNQSQLSPSKLKGNRKINA